MEEMRSKRIRNYIFGGKLHSFGEIKDRHGVVYMPCYFFFSGVLNLIDKRVTIIQWLIVFGVLLPLFIIMFFEAMHPIGFTKMYYLCPMNSRERKRYLYGKYFVQSICYIFIFGFYCAGISICIGVPFSVMRYILISGVINYFVNPLEGKKEFDFVFYAEEWCTSYLVYYLLNERINFDERVGYSDISYEMIIFMQVILFIIYQVKMNMSIKRMADYGEEI